MPNSENGWPLVGESNLEPLPWLPNDARLLAGPVATVLGYVARQFEARVEHITSTSSFRDHAIISGTSAYSNHASGTALDLNGGKHPMGSSGTFTAGQVAAIRAVLAECSGVLRWGGDYSSRPDEMHFEIRPGATPVQVAAAAAAVGATTPIPTPTPSEEDDMPWFFRRVDGAIAIVTPTGVRSLTLDQWSVWENLGLGVFPAGMGAMDYGPFDAVVQSLGGWQQ